MDNGNKFTNPHELETKDKEEEAFLSTFSLSMPLGTKLRVNMCREYSSKLENVTAPLQLIPVSSITHNHTQNSAPRLFRDVRGNRVDAEIWFLLM